MTPQSPHGWRSPKGGAEPYPPEFAYLNAPPKAPSLWPVIWQTTLFGILGVIETSRRARRARAAGRGEGVYWIVFGLLLPVNLALCLAAAGLSVPVYLQYREKAFTKRVESQIVADSTNAGTGRAATGQTGDAPTVRSADCTPVASGRYSCLIDFADGSSGTYTVVVDSDLRWRVER